MSFSTVLLRFGETFSKEPAESLHNLKSRQVWRQVRQEGGDTLVGIQSRCCDLGVSKKNCYWIHVIKSDTRETAPHGAKEHELRKKCFQVEPGFFLALSVSVPSSRKPGKEGEQVG